MRRPLLLDSAEEAESICRYRMDWYLRELGRFPTQEELVTLRQKEPTDE